MSRRGYLLPVLGASTLLVTTQLHPQPATHPASAYAQDAYTSTPVVVPTVQVPQQTAIPAPRVAIPGPTSVVVPTITIPRVVRAHPHKRVRATRRTPARRISHPTPTGSWIIAYLTSYCPGSAGSISSSGSPVFYGMLANDYFPFGTHVYIPVLGMTGVVEDRIGAPVAWNHFDVWSPVCYGTPTGYFRVAVQTR